MPLKIQIKLLTERDSHVDDYVPVFHRWIRESVLNELLIDVVDYTHVQDGPAIVLIGHDSDYALDRGEGKLGLLYANKRAEEVGVREALARLFRAASLLVAEKSPSEPLGFRTDELVIRVADRLGSPNTDETYERLLPELRTALESVYGSSSLELSRFGSSKELFSVRARIPGAAPLATLAERAAAKPS